MHINPLHAIDFYKTDHRRQYPEGTEYVYANFTARSSNIARTARVVLPDFDDRVVFFGLQGFISWFLQDCWRNEFFLRSKKQVLDTYKRRMDFSLGAGAISVDHIAALHDLGYLPLEIRALREGTRVPIGVPMFTIINTIPEFFWLPNYLETVLSNGVWKSCTIATLAHEYRRLLERYADETGGDKAFVDVQGHDFSCRGMSTIYDSASSGAAHLLSFIGTDSVCAIDYAERYYGGEVIGVSVPATEHSVMSMGTKDDEIGTYRRLITEIYPKGIVSIVSDTWDLWKVLCEYTPALKDIISKREGRIVFRPDSGNPCDILCGDITAARGSPAFAGAVKCLADVFGTTISKQGYQSLNTKVGLIYGDSINLVRAQEILERLKEKLFASDNVVFGIGSYTYQYITRDTFGFAMKSTWGQVKGVGKNIFKDPVTDEAKLKKSLVGLIRIHMDEDRLRAYDRQSMTGSDETHVVFKDGKSFNQETFTQIKNRLSKERIIRKKEQDALPRVPQNPSAKPGDSHHGENRRY